jgi:PAS domain S-box-containing protein
MELMKSQRDTSLQIRLAGIAILGLFIALAAAAYFSGQQVKRSSEFIATDAVPGTISAHYMRMAMSRSIGWVMVAASAETTQSRDASLKTVHDADAAFTNAVKEYETTIKINPLKDRELLARVTSGFAEFRRQRMAYEALILAGNRAGSAAFLESNLVPAYVSVLQPAEELLKYNHANSITYAYNIRNSVRGLYWTVAVVMVLAFICAAVLVTNFAIRRRELVELRESEQKYRGIIEQSPLGIFQSSVEGRLISVNSSLAAMFGYDTPEQMVNDNESLATQRFARPEERREIVRAVSESSVSIQRESVYRSRDGTTFPANVYMRAVRAANGAIQYLEGFVEDISIWKRAEDDLQLQSRMQELLMNMSAMYINLPLDAVESAIRVSLGELGEFVGADRMGVYNYDFKKNAVSATCEWHRDGMGTPFAELQAVPLADYPDWDVDVHRRGEPIYVPDVSSLAPGALKGLLDRLGAKSALVVPLMSCGACFGFVNFDWTRSSHACSGKEQYLLTFFAHILANIEQRQQSEQAVRESEEKFAKAFRSSPNGIAITKLETGRYIELNESFCQIYGYSREEMLGRTSLELGVFKSAAEREMVIQPVRALGRIKDYEMGIRTRDGEAKTVLVNAERLELGGKPCMVLVIFDITARLQTEERLKRTSQQLRALTSRLRSLQEEERTHLAREIHDHLGQLLTALNLDLRLVERRAASVSDPTLRAALQGKITSARTLADETITSVQKIATELRPAILDRLGLEAAVESEIQAFQSRTGIDCQWGLPSTPVALAPDQATAVFRVFQEILTNVARHAQASSLAVRMTHQNERLFLQVDDDGIGIQPGDIANAASLGLLGMKERVALQGGEITFERNSPRGTRVALHIPLNGKAGPLA